MENRWSEIESEGLSELDSLVYQSRLIGADQSLVIWGGGNTSLKVTREDFRGRETKVMLIKGSGSDMKAAQSKDFPSVRMDDILPLFERPDITDEYMVDYLEHCLLTPGSPRPSIETLLHAFLPQTSIVHTHADAILSLTNQRDSKTVLNQVFGSEVAVVDYMRPGFLLSKKVAEQVLGNPSIKGVALLNHGLITWGATPKISYEMHIELVNRAEEQIRQKSQGRVIFGGVRVTALGKQERRDVAASVTPSLRSFLTTPGGPRPLLRFVDDDTTLGFINSKQAKELVEIGAATPDHLLNTKRTPLFVEVQDPSYVGSVRRELERGVDEYRQQYAFWFHQHSRGITEMQDTNPRIILVPGIGMWIAGRDTRAFNVIADIYQHTITIMAGAQAAGNYASLSQRDAYDAEYWPLELYKLTLLPPEAEMARKVALVTGGSGGIGKAIARKIATAGAHVVLADIDTEAAQNAAAEINSETNPGQCISVSMDVTDPEQVENAFKEAVLAYGGLDILVSNAGVAPTGALDTVSLADWQRSLDVNATGHLLAGREAVRIMREQGLGGSLVFIATKNVPAPGRGFGAYSAAKAAEAQLARVFAMENGLYGIRSNMINPDAVFQDSGLWSQELKEERARAHGVELEELEDFYRRRNLLQTFITPNDVAEAVLWLAGDHSTRTTGCIISVDGGVPEAFPR